MNRPIDYDSIRHQLALNVWLEECRTKMSRRYPMLDFDADVWDPRTLHGDDIVKGNLAVAFADFQGKDRTFADAIRCLAAHFVLHGVKTAGTSALTGFRLLGSSSKSTLFDIDLAELRRLEEQCLSAAQRKHSSAGHLRERLVRLERDLETLYLKGVLPFLNYRVRHDTSKELSILSTAFKTNRRKDKASILDHQIEALNEAWNALADNDPRLTRGHQVALAAIGLEMCAPSRINEPLCMSIDDFATIENFARKADDTAECNNLYGAHQMLIITMKGSKGAQWSPKPVMNFMMQFFHYCIDLIKENGKRSRMLVEWYQRNPDKLYLPQELEHLRGKDLTITEVYRIMHLGKKTTAPQKRRARDLFKANQHAVKFEKKPKARGKPVAVLPWQKVEAGMLEMVREAMEKCRQVTHDNHYKGDLAKMLFLFDHSEIVLPFLPGAYSANYCGRLLKSWTKDKGRRGLTVFESLGITMPVNGKVQTAYIESHDPRRWLTTMAKIHGSKLSDVLINKWANRLKLSHLWHYDFETKHGKAAKSSMPNSPELDGLSKGGLKMGPWEEVCGLQQKFVEVHDIGVSVVSMNDICNASKNRPRAKTAEELVVLYPNWFGCCPHQHHATPCRAYSACLPCGENTVIKGHLPTNDHIRERMEQVHGSIVAEVKRLVEARKYEIADDQDKADTNIMALVRQGLDPDQMADHLIAHFYEIKDQIDDVVFRNMLEEAFVATGYVELLNDPNKSSGANLRYTNPSRHAAPGLELGMQAHGGPEAIQRRIWDFAARHPQFAPQSPEQMNQHLLPSPDDEIGGDEDKEMGDE